MEAKTDRGKNCSETDRPFCPASPDELICVKNCDAESQKVFYEGPHKPSSETIMHWLIYQNRPAAKAVIHAHDEFATRPEFLSGEVDQTECEAPCGTVELAHLAIKTFKKGRPIIMLKNHGYVATGLDLDKACDLIINTHLKLLAKKS